MSCKRRYGAVYALLVLGALITNCKWTKPAGESATKTDGGDGSLTGSMTLGKDNNYDGGDMPINNNSGTTQLITTDAGFATVTASVSYSVALAAGKKPSMKIQKLPGLEVIAEGNLTGDPGSNTGTYFNAAISIKTEPAGLYLITVAAIQGTDTSIYLSGEFKNMSKIDNSNPPLVSTQDSLSGDYEYAAPPAGTPMWFVGVLQRVGAPGIYNVDININTSAINEIIDSTGQNSTPPPFIPIVVFDPRGAKIISKLEPKGGGFGATLTYELSAQMPVTIPFFINFVPTSAAGGIKDGTLVNISAYVESATHDQTPRSSMGTIHLGFGSQITDFAYVGNKPFGMNLLIDENPIARNTTTPIDIEVKTSVTIARALNTNATPIPTTLDFAIASLQNVQTLIPPKNGGSSNSLSATLVYEQFMPAENELLGTFGTIAGGSVLAASDFIDINATVSVSTSILPPDASANRPLSANNTSVTESTITTPPPANYAVRPSYTPIAMDKAAVLAAMEQIRQQFHTRLPRGAKRTDSNSIDPGTIEACLGNEAPHWSDTIIHYYCQLGNARACYTNCVRAAGMAANARPGCFKECSQSGGDWDWIMKNDFEVAGHQAKVKQSDVFQYVMFSETFAFDMSEQEEVINKFYQVGDTNDSAECLQKRPRRQIDVPGNLCLPSKAIPLAPAGR